jgi:hypothetical protein
LRSLVKSLCTSLIGWVCCLAKRKRQSLPDDPTEEEQTAKKRTRRKSTSESEPIKPSRADNYKPKTFSGGWAMLVAMLDGNLSAWESFKSRQVSVRFSQVQVTTSAGRLCRSSFTVPQNSYFTAFESMKTLVSKKLVTAIAPDKNKPYDKLYWLTKKGFALAWVLCQEFIAGSELHALDEDNNHMDFNFILTFINKILENPANPAKVTLTF